MKSSGAALPSKLTMVLIGALPLAAGPPMVSITNNSIATYVFRVPDEPRPDKGTLTVQAGGNRALAPDAWKGGKEISMPPRSSMVLTYNVKKNTFTTTPPSSCLFTLSDPARKSQAFYIKFENAPRPSVLEVAGRVPNPEKLLAVLDIVDAPSSLTGMAVVNIKGAAF